MKLNLTQTGKNYLLQNLEGGPSPIFSAILLGDGGNAGETATSLSNQIMSIAINEIKRDDVFVTLIGVSDNSSITESFRATELGVLIKDPDNEGEHLLFAYGYVDEELAQLIPANTEYPFEIRENTMVYVGTTENVSALISESISTVNRTEFNEHTENYENPHRVNAEQVGLGNVPNVTTDDQTPMFEEAKVIENIESGEKMSILFGKIKKLIADVIAHLKNKNNPHGIKASQVGAAEKVHSHSADDIKSGVLGVERGGTGVSRYSDLRKKMNLGDSSGPLGVAYGGTGVTSYSALSKNLIDCGYYSGDGEEQKDIVLGFRPRAVLVMDYMGRTGYIREGETVYTGGLACGYYSVTKEGEHSFVNVLGWIAGLTVLSINSKGFSVGYSPDNNIETNVKGTAYFYIAIK